MKGVLVVGAGGLGSPAAAILRRAGVARLTLVDPDKIELENLHRQILFHDDDVGRTKVDVVSERLGVRVQRLRLDRDNGPALVADHACVLDGTDSFKDKYLLNDLCLEASVPLVHAGAAAFRGQVLVVRNGGPCLRCLLPEPPDAGTDECRLTGIWGPAAGAIAALAAGEVLRILAGKTAGSEVLVADLGTGRLHRSRLARRPGCICGERSALRQNADSC